MAKKVLVLVSSFRKKDNAGLLCDAGYVNRRKKSVNDQKIGFFHGCVICNETHKCVQNDNMPAGKDSSRFPRFSGMFGRFA